MILGESRNRSRIDRTQGAMKGEARSWVMRTVVDSQAGTRTIPMSSEDLAR
jgi:hypothetical protein